MPNIWEHPEIIAAEALSHLEYALKIAPLCAMDKTSDFINRANGWKVGDTVPFRTHGEYEAKEFVTQIDPQEIRTSTRSMTIEKFFDISVEVTAREEVMDLDDFSDQVIKPSMYSLAEQCDMYIGTKLMEAQGLYVSDTLFGDAADVAQARKAAILQQLAMNRFCLVDLDLEATLLGQTWFNQSQTRGAAGESTLSSGNMGHVMGMDFDSSISYPTNAVAFTAGSGTAVTNNDSGANNLIGDTTLVFDGGSASAGFAIGDRLKVAGVKRPLRDHPRRCRYHRYRFRSGFDLPRCHYGQPFAGSCLPNARSPRRQDLRRCIWKRHQCPYRQRIRYDLQEEHPVHGLPGRLVLP